MITAVVLPFVIQFVCGMIMLFSNAGDFRSSMANLEEYRQDLAKESRFAKIGLLMVLTSPLAILSVPAIALFYAAVGIKSAIQFVIPAVKYDGSLNEV